MTCGAIDTPTKFWVLLVRTILIGLPDYECVASMADAGDRRGRCMSESTAARLGDEKFISLTTFKRNGDAAASPMWIVRDGNQLLAWTPADAWKVKRIRRASGSHSGPVAELGRCAPNNPSSPAPAR